MTDDSKKSESQEDLRERVAHNRRREEWQRKVELHLAELSDPDERLSYWASNTLIWGEPKPALISYAEWLRMGSPDRWHLVPEIWNWDYGLTPLWWIANQPLCDAATALEIFYGCEPFYSHVQNEEAELIALIRERWDQKTFTFGGIEYNLPPYIEGSYHGVHLDRVPLSMRRSWPGRAVRTADYDVDILLHIAGG